MAKYEAVLDQTDLTMSPLTLAGPAGTEFLLDVRLSPCVERVLIRLVLTPEGHIVMRWAPLEYRTADSASVCPDCDGLGWLNYVGGELCKCQRAALTAHVEPDPAYGSEAWYFRELMATMHGDGGHYHAQHGAKKSYEDACAKYYRLVSAAETVSAVEKP